MYLDSEIQKIKRKLSLQSISISEQIILLGQINDILISNDYGEDKDFFLTQYEQLINSIGKDETEKNNYDFLEYKAYFYYLQKKTKRLVTLINSFDLYKNNDLLILLIELCISDNYSKSDVFELVESVLQNNFSDFSQYKKLEELLIGEYNYSLPKIDSSNSYEILENNETFSPKKLPGNWDVGYCLDNHTILDNETYRGYKNSYIGNVLREIKYKYNENLIPTIGTILSDFIKGKYIKCIQNKTPFEKIDFIIITPPSKLDRPFQPVLEIGKKVSSLTNIPFYDDLLIKTTQTPQTKTLQLEEAKKILKGIFKIKNIEKFNHKNILVLDDLYGTGTTLTEITETLHKQTNINKIFVLTLTKTRTKNGLRNNI